MISFKEELLPRRKHTYPNYTNRCSISSQIFLFGCPISAYNLYIERIASLFARWVWGDSKNGIDEGPSIQVYRCKTLCFQCRCSLKSKQWIFFMLASNIPFFFPGKVYFFGGGFLSEAHAKHCKATGGCLWNAGGVDSAGLPRVKVVSDKQE